MAKATVESTLKATMAEIRKGAAPWKIKDALITDLKKHYRPEFAANLDLWPKVRPKILRLARYQGAIAALLAESEMPEKSVPAWIKGDALWTASWIVQIGCPPDDGIHVLGRNCRTVPASRVDLNLLRRLGGRLSKVIPEAKQPAVLTAFWSSADAAKGGG
jgi:hypothetical protein